MDGLKIPITLSYHAGGVKFMQYDGDLGTGWSINAGGYRISRNILGKPDELSSMAPDDTLKMLQTRRTYLTKLEELVAWRRNIFYSFVKLASPYRNIDYQYDFFNYLLPTSSGSFIITSKELKEVAIAQQNLDKIELDRKEMLLLNDISVTDNKGFIYHFGGKKSDGSYLIEANYRRDIHSKGYKTAWPLKHIDSPLRNDIVKFSYNNHYVETSLDRFLPRYEVPDVSISYKEKVDIYDNPIRSDCQGLISYETFDFSTYNEDDVANSGPSNILFISKIETDLVSIEFYREEKKLERVSLKEIIIRSKSTGDILKKVNFNYLNKSPYTTIIMISLKVR